MPYPIVQCARGETVSCNNSSPTAIVCSLLVCNYIQAFIVPGMAPQGFTVTLIDGSTVEIPSGGAWEWDVDGLARQGDTVFQIQTALNSADVQIVFMLKRGRLI